MARKAPSQFTPPRIRALEYLEKNPGHHVVGCGSARWHIMRLGWSEWALNDRNQIIGEQLTNDGRAALTRHREIAALLSYGPTEFISEKVFGNENTTVFGKNHA